VIRRADKEHGVQQLPDWVPEGVEMTVPNAARIYDYLLGGFHNFAVDREVVDRMRAVAPGIIAVGLANRGFVARSVRWLTETAGIRQFLDIGSGIPTLGNVHEIAQGIAPDARVVYVDIDPVAVAHGRVILANDPHTQTIRADVTKPQEILANPEVNELLDFARPVAVLLNAVLHFVPDEADPAGIVAQLRAAMVRGSYLTITHGSETNRPPTEGEDEVREIYDSRTPTSLHSRTPAELLAFVDGMALVEPGLVEVGDWRPEPDNDTPVDPELPTMLAVVAREV
jgi:hypothetical protein